LDGTFTRRLPNMRGVPAKSPEAFASGPRLTRDLKRNA
jgi:hypothetical protein